jgi:hypothetical protein
VIRSPAYRQGFALKLVESDVSGLELIHGTWLVLDILSL